MDGMCCEPPVLLDFMLHEQKENTHAKLKARVGAAAVLFSITAIYIYIFHNNIMVPGTLYWYEILRGTTIVTGTTPAARFHYLVLFLATSCFLPSSWQRHYSPAKRTGWQALLLLLSSLLFSVEKQQLKPGGRVRCHGVIDGVVLVGRTTVVQR